MDLRICSGSFFPNSGMSVVPPVTCSLWPYSRPWTFQKGLCLGSVNPVSSKARPREERSFSLQSAPPPNRIPTDLGVCVLSLPFYPTSWTGPAYGAKLKRDLLEPWLSPKGWEGVRRPSSWPKAHLHCVVLARSLLSLGHSFSICKMRQ